jgi:hypothetical protein
MNVEIKTDEQILLIERLNRNNSIIEAYEYFDDEGINIDIYIKPGSDLDIRFEKEKTPAELGEEYNYRLILIYFKCQSKPVNKPEVTSLFLIIGEGLFRIHDKFESIKEYKNYIANSGAANLMGTNEEKEENS